MLKKTKDYSIFKIHPQNDCLDSANLARVKESISQKNLLEYRPILVDSKMQVIDGNHRLHAAKDLGVDIYYQIQEDATADDIAIINANARIWNMSHWIKFHASKGNENYLELQRFCAKHYIKPLAAVKILICTIKDKKEKERLSTYIKSGHYKFPSPEEVALLENAFEQSGCILETLKSKMVGNSKLFLNSSRIRQALCTLLMNPDCDIEVFKTKVMQRLEVLHPCATYNESYEMFRKIYNFRNQNPISRLDND